MLVQDCLSTILSLNRAGLRGTSSLSRMGPIVRVNFRIYCVSSTIMFWLIFSSSSSVANWVSKRLYWRHDITFDRMEEIEGILKGKGLDLVRFWTACAIFAGYGLSILDWTCVGFNMMFTYFWEGALHDSCLVDRFPALVSIFWYFQGIQACFTSLRCLSCHVVVLCILHDHC